MAALVRKKAPSVCDLLPRTLLPSSAQRRKSSTAPSSTPTRSNPRWLSDVKTRVGQCILFGLSPQQTAEAGRILDEIARDWRELLAGAEGFLTSKDRRSIHRREVVWGEMDAMGHVNNVVYNRYAESGRIAWAQKYANHVDVANREAWRELFTPKGTGLILRAITTDFKFPMKWPDHVTIYHKLRTEPTQGTDAFVLDVLMLSELHQRPVARCTEDIVVYDYVKGKKTPMQAFMMDAFQKTWQLQEQAKHDNSHRVSALLERVRHLELDSWDKIGAIEDMGNAKT